MAVIYVFTFPNQKQYVGQSVNLKKRYNNHKGGIQLVDKAIRKYGWNNINKLLIDNVPEEELDYWEKHYIQECNSIFPNGYNLDDGGNKNRHHSEEVKKRMSEAHKGILHSEEAKRKISKAKMGNSWNIGRHHTEEAKKKMGRKGKISWNKGKNLSEEIRRKMSEAAKKRKKVVVL